MPAPHVAGAAFSMLAPALLSLRFDMHLTRVSGASAHETSQAIATGGDGDLLALLLGGAGEASPAFPLTLEAALAGGEAAGDPLADASVEGPAETTDPAALSIDAALAAALALASAVAVDPATVPVEGGDADALDVVGVGDAIAADVAVTVADTAVAPAVDTQAGDSTAGADAAIAAAEASAAAAASAEQAATADAATAGNAASLEKPTQQAATATSAHATVTASEHDRAARPAGTTERSAHDAGAAREAAADAVARGRHGDDADAPPSFEHHDDGGRRQDDPAQAIATTTVEAPAKPTLTVTAPGATGDTTHVTRTEAIDPAATAAVQTSTNGATPSASSANAPARAEHTPLAHGTIEARWSERVSDAVRLSALRGGGEIRLQLEPEGLGHIDVRLDLHADGVRAVIVAEHESTRALLQSQQQTLHDAFGRSDLRLSGFSVDVGSGGAAAFQRGTDGGEGGHAPAAAPSAPSTTTSTDAAATASTTAGNGRVNVRV